MQPYSPLMIFKTFWAIKICLSLGGHWSLIIQLTDNLFSLLLTFPLLFLTTSGYAGGPPANAQALEPRKT
jgi:hypothetical protein